MAKKKSYKITKSSTAEYFAKNLQQVGFSSPTKAVLTTLKEAVDNSLDACEDHGILPDLYIEIQKLGRGSLKNTDKIKIIVEDNGPGIQPEDIAKVFGEYLASSKFGRGRCSRGQQGIGISAATTWAQQTTATGARVSTKTDNMRKGINYLIDIDFKNNKGRIKEKKSFDWDKVSGTRVEFVIDGRIQLKGEAGLLSFIRGNVVVNPHMSLRYKILDQDEVLIERVSQHVPVAPKSVDPHPHTMKLGDFINHAGMYSREKTSNWLKNGFSRVSDRVIKDMVKEQKLPKTLPSKPVGKLTETEIKLLYHSIQKTTLKPPSTQSVLSIGEVALTKSIRRLGEIDFISVHTRKPAICDFKPVQVEISVARFKEGAGDMDSPVSVLRFANRVPLQFDKASCAIVKAIQSVNWKTYGLKQSKNSLPYGPFIIAVSVVSPFIKFKNASKETIDAADDLVEELRRGMMKVGQKLSRHLRREVKAKELQQKVEHIGSFAPILVETLCRITKAKPARKKKAEEGLLKILERDTKAAKAQLEVASARLQEHLADQGEMRQGVLSSEDEKNLSDDALFEEVASQGGLNAADIEGLAAEKAEEANLSTEQKTGKSSKAKKKKKASNKKAAGRSSTKKAYKKAKKKKIAKKTTKKTTKKTIKKKVAKKKSPAKKKNPKKVVKKQTRKKTKKKTTKKRR